MPIAMHAYTVGVVTAYCRSIYCRSNPLVIIIIILVMQLAGNFRGTKFSMMLHLKLFRKYISEDARLLSALQNFLVAKFLRFVN